MTVAALPGAYGSMAAQDGAALYATPAALRSLAQRLRRHRGLELLLDDAPDSVVEGQTIERIRIVPSFDGEMVTLRRSGSVLEIAGGAAAVDKLAETLESLAEPDGLIRGEVRPHVDLEYHPAHGFLSMTSAWMTVLLL